MFIKNVIEYTIMMHIKLNLAQLPTTLKTTHLVVYYSVISAKGPNCLVDIKFSYSLQEFCNRVCKPDFEILLNHGSQISHIPSKFRVKYFQLSNREYLNVGIPNSSRTQNKFLFCSKDMSYLDV